MTPQTNSGGGLVILSTFALAFFLTVLPMPEWAQDFRPSWCTLVLIYWCLATPMRVGVGVAWLVGILLDISTETLLGQHALGLSIVAYITLKLHLRTRVFPLWQQSLTIFLLLLMENLVTLVVQGAIGRAVPTQLYWGPPLVGMLLWPLIFVVLRDLRRRFRVT
jgi:rod shape-determining protein MreD